ncbi:uncharacterized protein BXZ73DRAFT_78742 [Epithele typhae]|uniref:uncharacterized protein n=1 Tax=Epithele typhae TaxID=378194 RepID=UPI0020088D18|nr:uncharacterized protein BXZ73DRAFT_78742 [Epithele typhae]KAH9926663.1 hypothetical protein BXZ73DRAFT_78742 [Epithele typhae]
MRSASPSAFRSDSMWARRAHRGRCHDPHSAAFSSRPNTACTGRTHNLKANQARAGTAKPGPALVDSRHGAPCASAPTRSHAPGARAHLIFCAPSAPARPSVDILLRTARSLLPRPILITSPAAVRPEGGPRAAPLPDAFGIRGFSIGYARGPIPRLGPPRRDVPLSPACRMGRTRGNALRQSGPGPNCVPRRATGRGWFRQVNCIHRSAMMATGEIARRAQDVTVACHVGSSSLCVSLGRREGPISEGAAGSGRTPRLERGDGEPIAKAGRRGGDSGGEGWGERTSRTVVSEVLPHEVPWGGCERLRVEEKAMSCEGLNVGGSGAGWLTSDWAHGPKFRPGGTSFRAKATVFSGARAYRSVGDDERESDACEGQVVGRMVTGSFMRRLQQHLPVTGRLRCRGGSGERGWVIGGRVRSTRYGKSSRKFHLHRGRQILDVGAESRRDGDGRGGRRRGCAAPRAGEEGPSSRGEGHGRPSSDKLAIRVARATLPLWTRDPVQVYQPSSRRWASHGTRTVRNRIRRRAILERGSGLSGAVANASRVKRSTAAVGGSERSCLQRAVRK